MGSPAVAAARAAFTEALTSLYGDHEHLAPEVRLVDFDLKIDCFMAGLGRELLCVFSFGADDSYWSMRPLPQVESVGGEEGILCCAGRRLGGGARQCCHQRTEVDASSLSGLFLIP